MPEDCSTELDRLKVVIGLNLEVPILPFLKIYSLWEQSGRLDAMKTELLTTKDRNGKSFVLGPTHEEAVTSLISKISVSYR